MLDVARQTYKEGIDDVHQHMEDINRSCPFCELLIAV
jgi:hypothetical protein